MFLVLNIKASYAENGDVILIKWNVEDYIHSRGGKPVSWMPNDEKRKDFVASEIDFDVEPIIDVPEIRS